jgi:PAS domain S-box-containing protein
MRMKMILAAALMLAVLLAAGLLQAEAQGDLPLLTQAAQIRRLAAEEAQRGYPVRLRGVITYNSSMPEWWVTFFQDSTAGIFIFKSTVRENVRAGDLVEVRGRTGPGDFAPVVKSARVRVVGKAPLPPAHRFTLDDLLTGHEDSQWVEVTGVVRSVGIERPFLVLGIAAGSHKFRARISEFKRDANYASLIDAEVAIRGACGALFNDKRQLVGIQLWVPSLEQVHVEQAAPSNPYALPILPASSVMQFTPERVVGHRLRVQGVVTLDRPGRFISVQDASGGVVVFSRQSTPVQPGDRVDAVGFPSAGRYAPVLEDGEFRKIGHGTLPKPIDLTRATTLSGDQDAELVKIQGRLIDRSMQGEDVVLTIQTGSFTFTARLKEAHADDTLRRIPVGSLLETTGVWSTETDEYRTTSQQPVDNPVVPMAFRILLRSVRDIVVLEKPSGWTAGRIAWLLIILAGIVCWISFWVGVLRRRVEERTETIRATLESTVDGILVVNSVGKIVAYNRKFAEMLRIPESVLASRADNVALNFVLSQLKDPGAFLTRVRQTYADHDAHSDDVIEFKDGRVFERHSEPQRVKGKNVGRVWGFRDITERQRAERALQERTAYLNTLIENNPLAIVTTDVQGRVKMCNPAFERLFLYPRQEIGGVNLDELVTPPESISEALEISKQSLSGIGVHATGRRRRKDGSLVDVDLYGVPLVMHGEIVGQFTLYQDISARKQAEAALIEEKHLLHTLMDNLPDHIYFKDLQSRFIRLNKGMVEWFGLSDPAQALGKTDFDFFSDEHAQQAYADEQEVIRTGRPIQGIEEKETWPDGRETWASTTKMPLRDAQGCIVGTFGVSRDITARKQAEAALIEEKHLLHTLMDNLPDHIYFKDLQSRFIQLNKAMVKWFGLSDPAQAFGKTDFDFFSDEHAQQAYADEQEVIRTGRPMHGIEEKETWPDGRETWASTTKMPLRDAQGRIIGTFGVSRDITSRKQAEEALRASEEHFRSFIDNLPVGVYRTTPDGRVLMANPALLRMLAYDSLQDLASRNLEREGLEAGYPRSAFREEIERQGEVRGVEASWKRRDGSVVFFRESARAIRADDGAVLYYDGTIEEITERRRLEDQLRQAQKMEAIGRLAAGVAHDFNNLLTVVIGYSDLLLQRLPGDDRMRPRMEEIKKAGERAAWLTRQLLAFSRKQVLQPQILDLNSLLTNMDQMLRRVIGEDIELVTNLPPGLGRVKADPGQIEQVIMNLAVNARDAMPQGGQLTLEAANAELDSSYASRHEGVLAGHYVMLALSDTGIGMDGKTQAHIFEPFFTTKEPSKGTGLGLSTVYGIVKQSGGNIWVYSEPGKGTTFKVYLPRIDQAVEATAPGELGVGELSRGSETILLVEDEEAVRSLAREILERRGYHVLESDGAIKALEVGEGHKEHIHLLLTDVVMPQMSGRELAEHLAPLHPETKVLYMSGYADNAVVHHGLLDPSTALLQKPFTAQALARKLREVLDSAGDHRTEFMTCASAARGTR